MNVGQRIRELRNQRAQSFAAAEWLENWKAAAADSVERMMNRLDETTDELVTLSQSPEGAHVLKGNHHQLCQILRRLHDLALETKP